MVCQRFRSMPSGPCLPVFSACLYGVVTMRWVFLACLLVLAGCATVPRHTTNACAMFDEKDSFFDNWRDATKNAEARWGVPAPILLATIYTESASARMPARRARSFSASFRGHVLRRPMATRRRWTARGLTTLPRRGGILRAVPGLPMRSISPAGSTARATTRTASRSTIPTISIWPIIPASRATRGRAIGEMPTH